MPLVWVEVIVNRFSRSTMSLFMWHLTRLRLYECCFSMRRGNESAWLVAAAAVVPAAWLAFFSSGVGMLCFVCVAMEVERRLAHMENMRNINESLLVFEWPDILMFLCLMDWWGASGAHLDREPHARCHLLAVTWDKYVMWNFCLYFS